MKRNSERCMALVLALMMILSLFPAGALAEGDGSLPVHFICDETTASVTVYDAGGRPVAVGADGVHHLTPGTYSYSATAEGYESTGMQTFMVPEGAVGDQELRLSLTPVKGGEQPAAAPEQIPQGDSAPKQDPQNETEPSPTPQIEDDGKLRIYPADGSFHLTIDGKYTTAAAVPAELQEAVGGKDKEAAKPGAENADAPAPGLYLKQPAAEELYLDRLAVEKAIGYFTTDWTVVNLVDEEGERKAMTGSYDVIVSGPAMDKYASARPVFALLTLHWDEEGDIVDRDVSIIEPNVTPGGSSWSFRTDTLSTLVIATPTGNPYVEENTKDETKQPEESPAPETEQPAETPKEKREQVTLTYRATKGGVLSAEQEIVDVTRDYISVIGVFANPDFGYHFRDWTDEDGNVVSESLSLIPEVDAYTEDHTYTANFLNADGVVEALEAAEPVAVTLTAEQVSVGYADVSDAAAALGLENTEAVPVLPEKNLLKTLMKRADTTERFTRSGYVGLEISVDEAALTENGEYIVPVTLPDAIDVTGVENAVIDRLEVQVYHVVDGEAVPVEATCTEENGLLTALTIQTDGFSPYIVSYTVEFHNGENEVVIDGGTQVLLSTLITELGLTRPDGSGFTVDDVAAVEFKTPELFQVEEVTGETAGDSFAVVLNAGTDQEQSVEITTKHDFVLTSTQPFTADQMILTFTDGTSMTVDVTDEVPYTIEVEFLDETGAAAENELSDSYYVVARNNWKYFYQKITGKEPITIDGTINGFRQNETDPLSPWDPGQPVDVYVYKPQNSGEELTFNEASGAPYSQNAVQNGKVESYMLSQDSSETGKTRLSFKSLPNHKVVINLYDYDGITSYAPEELQGNYYVRVLAADQNGEKFYAVKPVTLQGKTTAQTVITDFWPENQNMYSQNTVPYDPDTMTITDVRLISDNGGQVWNYETASNAHDTVPGFTFMGNVQEGNTNTISLKRSYAKEYSIRLSFDPEKGTIPASDNYYVFVTVKHKTTDDTYFLKKLEITESSFSAGKNYVEIPVPNWQDGSGNELDGTGGRKLDSYTGEEESITLQLLKANGELNVNNAVSGTGYAVISEGGNVKDYKVNYGTLTTEKDDEAHIDHAIHPITLKKVVATEDYSLAGILGPGMFYGINAEFFDKGGHDQTNYAVNYFANPGTIDSRPDLAADKSVSFVIANLIRNEAPPTVRIGAATPGHSIVYINGTEEDVQDDSGKAIVIPSDGAVLSSTIVEPILNHGDRISAELASHPATITPDAPSTVQYVLDTTAFPENATIYVDADKISDFVGKTGGLEIHKKDNQIIVFNFQTSTNVSLQKFFCTVNGELTASNSPEGAGDQNVAVDQIARHIVWNMPNAANVEINTSTGVFLIPRGDAPSGGDEAAAKANSDTQITGTSSGWIISDGYVHNQGSAEWHNVFADMPDATDVYLRALKTLDGKTPGKDKTFSFEFSRFVANSDPAKQTGMDADGFAPKGEPVQNDGTQINYRVTELEDGANVYRIREIRSDDGSIISDTKDYYVWVYLKTYQYVEDNTTKTIWVAGAPQYYKSFDQDSFDPNSSTPTGVSDPVGKMPTFLNRTKTEGEAVLSAKKAANTNLGNRTFQFELLDASGAVLQTSDPVKQGETATFAAISYELKDVGEYTYKIKEVLPDGVDASNPTKDGITYDTHEETVTVKVENTGDGTLTVKYNGQTTFTTPEFTNTYAAEAEVTLEGEKQLEGRAFQEGDSLTVSISSSDGGKLPDPAAITVTLTAGQNSAPFTFGEISYDQDDLADAETAQDGSRSKIFTYSVTETAVMEGVTADSNTHTVTLTVTDDGKGNMSIVKNYSDGDKITFVNTYSSAEGEAELSAKKVFTGREWTDNDSFEFTLAADANNPEGATLPTTLTKTATKNEQTVTFDKIKFTKEGTYTFSITETKGTLPGVSYDTAPKIITVTVSKGADGKLITSCAPENATVTATNTYETGDLELNKVLVSDAAADADQDFTFTVTLGDTSISGDYGDMAFTNGVATVTLKGGEKKTATGLPTGISYTITEANADGFELTAKTGDTGTISTTKSTAEFTNTRETGDLELSKTVISDAAADADQVFTFTVTLSDTTISKTYGDMTFADGVATVTLKGGESANATGLPTGITYTITEETATGFEQTGKTGDTGTISTTKSSASFTNTREVGDLELSKVLVSDATADADQVFTFTVTLGDTSISGTYGEMAFTNGVATVTLKGGESKTATGLPTGISYTITEETATGFQVTAKTGDTGTISTTKSSATFTNARIKGGLTVSKNVVSDAAADKNIAFTFTVALGDTSISGTYGEMAFTNGVATFTLKDGESKNAADLPTGVTYTVTEASATGFQLTGKTGDTGTISSTASVAEFTNTREVGDLELSKVLVSDAAADKNIAFTFTVTLGDTSINGTYGDMTFADGVATVTLKGGESATATGLPTGITYTITEAAADGFQLTSKTGDSGTISTTKSKASFKNTREVGDLELSKVLVSDAAADKDAEFTFTVTLSDTSINGTYGEMAFTNGVATVKLKGGESATATGLPTGISYTITEETATGFQVTAKTGDTGTISTTKSVASFTNTRVKGGLTVSKNVVSDAAADKNIAFTFTVTLGDTSINGTYGDMAFTNGVATFTLKDGESKNAADLPTGVTYTVTEASATGFQLTGKTGDTGTISSTASVAEFTNTREVGDLELSKVLVSDAAADKNIAFTFTVTLSDTTISKTYGDMAFTSGVATVKLKGGESATATGLPTGITYTITEAEATGFEQTGKTGDTGTISTTKSSASFTNTREVGDLELSKVLVSDAAADADQVFTFTVTLGDTSINGTYGDMTFANGVATVTLKGGESKTATDLPTGISYTITEAAVDGITNTGKTGDTGTISTTKSVASFTNTRVKGGLTVSKTVVSDAAADKDAEFTFTVTLSDTSINGTYGDMAFTSGVATVTLKGGESATAADLPTGVTYTVTEASATGFQLTAKTGDTGTISSTASVAEFTNTRETGDLELSKTVISDAAADKDAEFTFTVTLSDTTISKTYGNMAFTSGVATVKLKGGESATATGLPTGITYTITEAEATGFEQTGKTGDSGTISKTKSTAVFTNTREVGALELSKVLVSDAAADKEKLFTFTITLSDTSINKAYSGVTFTNGVGTVGLLGGQSATIEGLPTGITYTITEANADGFELTAKTGDTGTISTTKSTAEFTNTRETGDLELSKTVISDAAVDKTKEFTFTVTLSDTTISKTYGDMTFADGVATVTLKGGESAAATGLPTGITYTITEAAADGFELTAKTGDTGTISTTKTTAEFTNTRETGDLELSKTVISDAAADKDAEFTFTVTLSDTTISKTYGDMTFASGVATVTLKDGESATATGLPTGITYRITEETATGFQVTAKTGDSGTISTTKSTASFTNTRETGDLELSKVLVSDLAADADQVFTFTVTLSDTTISKTYGDMTFASGVATVKLKGGESKTATGLPTGITYRITEETATGFQVTAKTGDTGTISTTKSSASFTNTRETGDLTISKTLVSDLAADKDQIFTFRVELADETINGAFGDITFLDGKATVTIKGGESKTAKGLPTTLNFKVTEVTVAGFDADKTEETGTISKDTTAEAAFTNTRQTGDLELSKELISDLAADKSVEFIFTVTLGDDTISGTYGDMTFDAGKATVTLKGGESKKATGLPTTLSYTITEADADGFELTGKTGDTGTISKDTTKKAEFTNKRDTGDLKVTKTLKSDLAADQKAVFDFTVTLADTTISGIYGGMTFTEGVATFSLKGGESKSATNLPTTLDFTVEEKPADGFDTEFPKDNSGTINKEKPAEIEVVNTRQTGDLEVTKTVESALTADKDMEFQFTVTLEDKTISGTYGEMEFTDGVATFPLKDGETKKAEGLPTTLSYTVAETAADGFTTEYSGETGAISKDAPASVSVTNTRRVSTLRITKRVSGTGASTKTQFPFTVYLRTGDGTLLEGQFPVKIYDKDGNVIGDAAVNNGMGTFKLAHGQYAVVYEIPVTAKWEVAETDAKGYSSSAETAKTGVIGEKENVSAWENHRSSEAPIPKTGYGDGTATAVGLFSSLGVFLASAVGTILQGRSMKKKKRGGSHAAD